MKTKTNTGTATAFNEDVAVNDGYLYTTNARESSVIANARLTEAALKATSFGGKRVLDVGCGDGTYTVQLNDRGHPESIHGIDYAEEAIRVARSRNTQSSISYSVCSAESLPFPAGSFELAHLRGVLHHLDNPKIALSEALRVAKEVVIIEPNGYNPVLKAIERISPYHRKHREQSFAPARLRSWVRKLGGQVRSGSYAGLVPFFCPDIVARGLKALEPAVEQLPIARQLSCAVFVCVVTRQ